MYKFFVLAASAALASAYTTPTTQCTDGCNPIAKPGLNEIVNAGSPYQITWQPTTDGTVTLVLLKGPSENIIPLYAVAEKIANTGSYSWTPAADLQPTGDRGYGFQIINDANGEYQWSTQFGIANEGIIPSSSGSASTPSGSAIAGGAVMANGTISSAAATSAAPTGFSNSTAIITSMTSEATDASTTLTRATSARTSAAASSSAAASDSGAVALGAFSLTGAFAAVMAAVAAL